MFNLQARKLLPNLAIISTILSARYLKFSWIIGSQTMWFSAINIAGPLSGILGGWSGGLLAFGTRLVSALLTGSALAAVSLAYLPHLAASWYWRTNFKFARVGFILLSMLLFIMGTHYLYGTANYAQIYALLWLIPAGIGYWQPAHKFWLALGSTFSAHAVGSLIWLATVPMTGSQWVMTMPIALVERLLFAAGIYAVYQVSQLAIWTKILNNLNSQLTNFQLVTLYKSSHAAVPAIALGRRLGVGLRSFLLHPKGIIEEPVSVVSHIEGRSKFGNNV